MLVYQRVSISLQKSPLLWDARHKHPVHPCAFWPLAKHRTAPRACQAAREGVACERIRDLGIVHIFDKIGWKQLNHCQMHSKLFYSLVWLNSESPEGLHAFSHKSFFFHQRLKILEIWWHPTIISPLYPILLPKFHTQSHCKAEPKRVMVESSTCPTILWATLFSILAHSPLKVVSDIPSGYRCSLLMDPSRTSAVSWTHAPRR